MLRAAQWNEMTRAERPVKPVAKSWAQCRHLARQSKNPMGLIETLRLVLPAHCGYSCAARGCDAPGSSKSTRKEAILDGRKKHH